MAVFAAGVVLLMILCDVVGLYGRLATVARIDISTSLQDRRSFEEQFRLAFANARRLRASLALFIVEIDSFKRYTDSYGHSAADECLRWVARTLAACAMRPYDLVARYDAEQFAIILPDTALHGALVLAERMRSVVERLEIVHGSQPLATVTLSIGVGYTTDAQIDEGALFELAGRALHDAKQCGGNRVLLGSTARHPPRGDALPRVPEGGARVQSVAAHIGRQEPAYAAPSDDALVR